MPKSEKESTQVFQEKDNLKLVSYPLPLIFWGYFLILSIIILSMAITVSTFISKLLGSEDIINKLLGVITLVSLLGIPLIALCFLFYKKEFTLSKKDKILCIKHYVFRIVIKKEIIQDPELYVSHYLSSPNMAALDNDSERKAFQNRGHFILTAKHKSEMKVIDRHTNKADLNGLKKLIQNYLI
tara:strand:+ start:1067 stop:1618 length:552 start_codon:yes stop_codon:yes gene_type:complete